MLSISWRSVFSLFKASICRSTLSNSLRRGLTAEGTDCFDFPVLMIATLVTSGVMGVVFTAEEVLASSR